MSAITIGVAGLGYWGPNLARNFDDLGTLTWLCDADRSVPMYDRISVAEAREMIAELSSGVSP